MSVLLDETPAEVVALRVPPSEWRLILRARPNLLVEEPYESTERLIAALATHSPAALSDWRHSTETAADATLLVRDVDTLSAEEQRELMARIKSDEDPVTPPTGNPSATPVFPLIERGLFPEALYYRLNSVRLTIGEAG